jgi:hypothetical protein
VIDLQQRLIDDSPDVVDRARQGLRQILHRIYTGDQNKYVGASGKGTVVDWLLIRLFGQPDPDVPEPWWLDPMRQRIARSLAIVVMLIFAAAAALAIWTDHVALAILLVALAGSVEALEGAFTRVVKLRSPTLSWASCVARHCGELVMVGSIAAAQHGITLGAWAVIAAVQISLFGSFVRVSALQAGYRFWVSRKERYMRYLAIFSYCILSLLGFSAEGALVAAALVGGFGIMESAYVMYKVMRGPRVRSAELIFIDRENQVREISLLSCEKDVQDSAGALPPTKTAGTPKRPSHISQ